MLTEHPITPTNTSGDQVINKQSQQGFEVSDGTNNRVLIGFQKDGFGDGKDYGIKVSQEGFDVNTAADDELVMSSGFNMFKILSSGTTSVTVTDPLNAETTHTTTIAHNLGYSPAFLAYVTVPSGWSGTNANQLTALPTMLLDNGGVSVAGNGGVLFLYVNASVDSTNLYLKVLNPAGTNQAGFGNPWIFKYYILQETAA